MTTYLANGARLAWLLFPEPQAVEIWRAPADPASSATSERLAPATPLEDGELLPGLRLDLAELWAV
jgi:Uma2 family endonuclease